MCFFVHMQLYTAIRERSARKEAVFCYPVFFGANEMKIVSIKENHLFQKAYASGKRASGRLVAVYALQDRCANRERKRNPEKKFINRVGLTVSKKIGGAVVRSRVRRIFRTAYRALMPDLKTGYLLVLVARAPAAEAKSTEALRELRYLFKKLELLAAEPEAHKPLKEQQNQE